MRLELYHKQQCPYSARVRQAIEGAGLKEVIEYHEITEEPGAADELNELTGKQQVPCLVIDGDPLLESHDIVSWLESHEDELKTEHHH